MAVMELWRRRDLEGTVKPEYIDGNFFTQDSVGNLVGVKCYKDGAEVALTGSVTGYCVLPSGETVSVAGTRSGNQASILVPQSALAYTGPLGITLKLIDGNTITTLMRIIVVVYRSKTDTVITPSSQIITDWANQISAALQEVEDASAAQDAKIDDLKSALNVVEDALVSIDSWNKLDMDAIEEGVGLTVQGAEIENDSCVSDFIPVRQGDVVYITGINSGGTFYKPTAITVQRLVLYDTSKAFVSYTDWANSYSVPSDGYVRLQMASSWASWQVVSFTLNSYPTVKEEVTAFVLKAFESVTDTSSKVADSKLILIRSENRLNLNDPDLKTDTIIQSTGVLAENTTCFTSGYIEAQKGDVVTYSKIKNGNFQRRLAVMTRVAYYNSKKVFLSASATFVGNDIKITENDCAYIRVCLPNDALSADIACVSINAKPAQASIEEYFTPYYSPNGEPESVINSRKVLWLGTSIPTYGYPQLLGKYCNAHMTNNALGSSGIAKGVRANITTANICGIRNIYGLFGLTQTVAEKQAMIDNWSTIASEIGSSAELTSDLENLSLNYSSYETILDPYLTGTNAVDLIVINHCYNDSEVTVDVLAGSDPFDVYTMEGAYNWIIRHILEANPTIGIAIFGHYTDLSDAKEEALQKVADRWHIPYYLLKKDLGWSNTQTIATTKKVNAQGEWESVAETTMTIKNMWCGDGLHPLGVASVRIATVATAEFDKWVKAFCNHNTHSSY